MNINAFDLGIQKDFTNMTLELGNSFLVLQRTFVTNYEGQEAIGSAVNWNNAVEEKGSIQELESKNEAVQSGFMSVGDVKITGLPDSLLEEECLVKWNDKIYKVLKINSIQGFNRNLVTHVTAYGVKVSGR